MIKKDLFKAVKTLAIVGMVALGVGLASDGSLTAQAAESGVPTVAAGYTGWQTADGKDYWYEDGVRQGTEGRGKEIYDPSSDAWYWLDSVRDGAKATDKDVYMPYTINGQDEIGKWVRYDENGAMIKNEDYRYGGWYFFDEVTGAMTKSFTNISDNTAYGKWVYYDEVTGQMAHGEDCINGNWYRFDDITGKMVHGEYCDSNGNWYRYDDITGIMVKGVYTDSNAYRYYYDDTTGIMYRKTEELVDIEETFKAWSAVFYDAQRSDSSLGISRLSSNDSDKEGTRAKVRAICKQYADGETTVEQTENALRGISSDWYVGFNLKEDTAANIESKKYYGIEGATEACIKRVDINTQVFDGKLTYTSDRDNWAEYHAVVDRQIELNNTIESGATCWDGRIYDGFYVSLRYDPASDATTAVSILFSTGVK